MKTRLFFLILSILLPSNACAAEAKSIDNLEYSLQEAFRAISFIHYGLDFPPNQDIVDRCYANRDESCLRTFEPVIDAKRYIVTQVRADPDRALQITLDTIFKFTEVQADAIDRITNEGLSEECTYHGAIMALYFFNRDEQDRKILDRIKSAPLRVLNSLFGDYEWQYNRPEPQRWIEFVKALPEKDFPASHKEYIISCFRKAGRKKFGLMLEPPLNADRSRKIVPE